jgi:hypothetical protein
MNYNKTRIVIPTDQGQLNVTAMEAEGTGLAIVKGKHAFGTYYTITTLNAENRAIVNWKDINSEPLARLFLEEIVKVADCSSLEAIKNTITLDGLYTCYFKAQEQLEQAKQPA